MRKSDRRNRRLTRLQRLVESTARLIAMYPSGLTGVGPGTSIVCQSFFFPFFFPCLLRGPRMAVTTKAAVDVLRLASRAPSYLRQVWVGGLQGLGPRMSGGWGRLGR